MNYHSDDDVGVQATIAAVSLGAPADMHFCQKGSQGKSFHHCLRITLTHVSTSPERRVHWLIETRAILSSWMASVYRGTTKYVRHCLEFLTAYDFSIRSLLWAFALLPQLVISSGINQTKSASTGGRCHQDRFKRRPQKEAEWQH